MGARRLELSRRLAIEVRRLTILVLVRSSVAVPMFVVQFVLVSRSPIGNQNGDTVLDRISLSAAITAGFIRPPGEMRTARRAREEGFQALYVIWGFDVRRSAVCWRGYHGAHRAGVTSFGERNDGSSASQGETRRDVG